MHTVRCCLLCEPGDHFVKYQGCPALASANITPAWNAPTLVVADETSGTAIADKSRNRGRRQRKGHGGTPLVDLMITAADKDGTSVPSVVVEHQGERISHDKVLILPESL